MKIISVRDVPVDDKPVPIFVGGKVGRQQLVGPDTSGSVRVGLVRFEPGARNLFHIHSVEQILYIVEGRGVVATEDQEAEVTAGTLVYIPPGERHWHGATADSPMAHITIGPPGETRF